MYGNLTEMTHTIIWAQQTNNSNSSHYGLLHILPTRMHAFL